MDPRVEELLARFFINGPPIEDQDQLRVLRSHVGWWVGDVMSGDSKLVEQTFKAAELQAPSAGARLKIAATVGAIVLNHSKEYMLVVKDCQGKYSLPKGKLDADESFELGACREVLEETGVDISRYISTDKKVEFQTPGVTWVLFIVKLPRDFHTKLCCCRRGEVSKVLFMSVRQVLAVKQGMLSLVPVKQHVQAGIEMID